MPNVAVIHHSATGHVHQLAEAVAAGAEEAGADVRLRRVPGSARSRRGSSSSSRRPGRWR